MLLPALGMVVVGALAGWVLGGAPTDWDVPVPGGLSVDGGSSLTPAFLNLTKNSSLAVAIGYPDVVSISNTAINQTGRAVECIAVIMAVYLTTSLGTSALMNWYNKRAAIKER